MQLGIDLGGPTEAQKDGPIDELAAQLQAALARIADLKARLDVLGKPPKTPESASTPPSKGQKTGVIPVKKQAAPAQAAPWPKILTGWWRRIPTPTRIVRRRSRPARRSPQEVYDRIELPPIKPDISRVHLFGGFCACCGECGHRARARRLEPGSRFGRTVAAMMVDLHYAQAVGVERRGW